VIIPADDKFQLVSDKRIVSEIPVDLPALIQCFLYHSDSIACAVLIRQGLRC